MECEDGALIVLGGSVLFKNSLLCKKVHVSI